jgi:nitrate reductase (NAD(P)H)
MSPSREVVTGIESGSSTLRITFPVWLTGDEREDIDVEEAAEKYHELQEQAEKGKLVNLRDVINAQEDLHLRRLDIHSEGWRYDLNVRESYIKNEEEWLANVNRDRKRRSQEEKRGGKGKS